MGYDPVERELAGRLVQIAFGCSQIRGAVEAAVELGKDCGAVRDVIRVRVCGAIARGQQSGNPGSSAQIEKSITRAKRDEVQEQPSVGNHRRVDQIVRRSPLVPFDGTGTIGNNIQIAKRVKRHGS